LALRFQKRFLFQHGKSPLHFGSLWRSVDDPTGTVPRPIANRSDAFHWLRTRGGLSAAREILVRLKNTGLTYQANTGLMVGYGMGEVLTHLASSN
jgi:hypothetical protein